METNDDTVLLTAIEARILGSLFEKQATTPDVYPLTLNAVVLACNQKTAREPVMQLEPGEVGHALRQLEARGWVKAQHTARADRYEHRLESKLGLPRAQIALMALLMLRGAQTAAELLTRSERLASFTGMEDLLHALERLGQRTPALVARASRQAGQREDRFVQLLCGGAEHTQPVPAGLADTAASTASSPLMQRVEDLERRVAELEARVLAVSHPLAGI